MAESQTNIGLNVSGDLNARDISVVQTVNNIIKPADPPPKNIRFKVEKPIKTFTGRETFLEEFHKVVKEGQYGGGGGVTVLTHDLSVVAATGGIGKTETVRRYIQLHEHEYDHIIWIDAEDVSFAKGQFNQLAMRLKISTDFGGKPKEFELILTEIFEKLLLNAHVVLLVFDNAEALEDDEELNFSGIRSLCPKSMSPFFVEPTIIVTSRNMNWSLQKVIHLDLWTEPEVVIFVFGRLGLKNNSENEKLALQLGTLFGRLPIALQAAVAVILQQTRRKKNYGIGSLIDEYDNGCRKMLAQKPLDANMRPAQTSIPMLVLWNISLEKIVKFKDGELAIKILCFMSYMSPVQIPQDFLYSLFENEWSHDSFENAIVILQDYSLIVSLSSEASDSHSFSIHRMIQDSTIENLRTRTNKGHTPLAIFSRNTFLNETEVLLKLSAGSLNYLTTFTTLKFSRRGELVENLVQITNHVSEKLDIQQFRDLTAGVAEVLQDTNNFPKSIELFERALEATPAPCNQIEILNKAELQRMLADAYGQNRHFQKSIDLCLEVLKVHTIVLGPHHEDTLIAKFKVAANLNSLERHDEAIEILLEVLQVFENNGDSQSKQYLIAKCEYAAVLFAKGEKKVASELLTQVLKEQEKDTDSNIDAIIVINGQIAFQLGKKGHLEEASKMCLQNLKDATKRLGPFDLTTLYCKQSYASALYSQQKYDEAASLLLELLEIQETQLGSEHPKTLSTKFDLGSVYLATKELDKAETFFDVKVVEKVFGPEHPETLNAATFLSSVKEEQGKFKDALALLEKVLEVNIKALAPNNEDTLYTLYNISMLHYKMGEYEKAAEVLQERLERQEEAIGKDHPDAIKTLEILTMCRKLIINQNNITMALMALTSVDAKTGKSFLKASNWNLEAALESYRNSNPNAHIADQDHESTSRSGTLTAEENQNDLIVKFMAVTGVNAETGKSLLQALDWNLKVALDAFFDFNSDEDTADLSLEGQALILSAAATAPENLNVATTSCNKTEINKIEDLGVQVESVQKPNRSTTSIAFRFPGGARLQGEFSVSSPVKNLYKFLIEKRPDLADSNYVLTLYPNTELTEMGETLEEANLLNNVALTLKMLKK